MARRRRRYAKRSKADTQALVEDTLAHIDSAVKTGTLAAPLATVFLQKASGFDKPQDSWSPRNQLLALLQGSTDSRTVPAWNRVGRWVKAGSRADVVILEPAGMRRWEVEDDEGNIEIRWGNPADFLPSKRFSFEMTDGDPLPVDEDEKSFLEDLPLVDVAEEWGVTMDTFSGVKADARGWFRQLGDARHISLGVEDVNTWLHELMHAADERAGNLVENGQHLASETVAQFGATVLAHIIGRPDIADEGKTVKYITGYAEAAGTTWHDACHDSLARTIQALEQIFDHEIE